MSIMPEGGWGELSPREKTGTPERVPPPSWMSTSNIPSSGRHSLKLLLPVGLLGAVFFWHIFLSLTFANSHLSVNPFSDVVTVRLSGAETSEITDPIERAIVEGGMSLVAAPIAENKLNLSARQHFDIYAWLIPYRVTFGSESVKSAVSPTRDTSHSDPDSRYNDSKPKISNGPWGTKDTLIELSDKEAETMTRLNQQYLMDNSYIKNGNPIYMREAASLRQQMEAIIYPYTKDNPWFDGGWMCASTDGTCKTIVPYSALQ
jgi:hypothetical protein